MHVHSVELQYLCSLYVYMYSVDLCEGLVAVTALRFQCVHAPMFFYACVLCGVAYTDICSNGCCDFIVKLLFINLV